MLIQTLLTAAIFLPGIPETDRLPGDDSIYAKWKVTSAIFYGKESPQNHGETYEFRKYGRLLTQYPRDKTPQEGDYRIDLEKTPHHLDMQRFSDHPDMGGGGPTKGIFKVQGDVLTICISGSANWPRPEEFASKKESRNILWKMKRVPMAP